MISRSQRNRGRLAALLVPLAIAVNGDALAGMLPMAESIADFTFADGMVVYSPSLSDDTLTLTSDNAVRLTQPNAAGTATAIDRANGVTAVLRLRADTRRGNLLGGEFNIFGSLTPVSDEGLVELVSGTLSAMQVTGTGDSFGFLFVGKSATGPLALQYRNIGIFTSVAGIADEDWVRDFDSSASLMNLVLNEGAAGLNGDPNNRAVPIPPTPLLLLAGLPLLGLRRLFPRALAQ